MACLGVLKSSVFLRRQAPVAIRHYSSTAQSVQALVYSQHGSPSKVLKWHTYPLAPLTKSTVHVQFLASPINPADVNQIQGVYPVQPPFLPLHGLEAAVGGNEGVAKVVAVGESVRDVCVGDHVLVAKPGYGTWRTYAAGPPEDFQVIPKSHALSLVQQATLSVNPCTAYCMLKDFVTLQPGDFILQNGSNSAVGQAVIQIAKAWGLNTINVVRDRPDLESLRKRLTAMGATYVITNEQLTLQETRAKVKQWVGDKKLLLALNCVGGKSATEMARYLSDNGQYVTYGAMARAPLSLPASMLIFKDIAFRGFWMTKWAETHTKEEKERMLWDLVSLMETKQLAEPHWTPVAWHPDITLHAVDQGIQAFGKGKQVILFEE
ncbi:hypothetical protein BDF14DRAFT_1752083 [Spinellus fusiger]|nr:hypothetical protein BDF14DRAFT_1752083 [Spinellus fusiger]